MRIGILGGTFDPPHKGHLMLAQAALEQLELDDLIFMPANRNPIKGRRQVAEGADRLEMVRRLIQGEEKMAVSDLELTRGGPSYTVETLAELHMIQPADYWFILGADSLKTLPEWKNPLRLVKLCRLAVAVRPPTTPADVLSKLPEEFRAAVDVVRMSPQEVSSTEVRERLAQGQGTADWLAPGVANYIKQKRLYR